MARIAGIDLPEHKRIDIALTYLYGIGRSNVRLLLENANVEANKKVLNLTEEEINRLQKAIDKNYKVEGDLRAEIAENIKHLKEINTYRGLRHARGLPVRGQRTRSNARTKRGKRATVGAMRKDIRAKLDKPTGQKE